MSKKAVQFGAGNIGRGFLGQLYFETGYETTFVDVVAPVVEGLNTRHEYPLRIVEEQSQTLTIGNVSAINSSDVEAVADAVAAADLASTAVGVSILPRIAPLVAAGIARRFQDLSAAPLNFIICENLIGAGPYFREEVRKHLAPAFHGVLDDKIGFVEASIGRMVPVMTEKQKAEDPLLVCVEAFSELPVDKNGFKGPIPPLKNMKPRDNFGAYVERKLFVHNMSHAVTGYLGYLRGHEYIWQAVTDPKVRVEVDAALSETCQGLVAKHGLDPGDLKAHGEDLLRRYQNKGLGDQVARIAKDPIRKLGNNDRLIGAALMCLEQGIEPTHVAFASAAAIRYDHPEDGAAQSVQEIFRARGTVGVLTEVSKLAPEAPLTQLILAGEERLRREGWL